MPQAAQNMQADDSPVAFLRRSIRHHSTPLNAHRINSSNGTVSSTQKRKRKRRWNENDVIDLTPKKLKLVESDNHGNDSDVEIIEPEPPTIIDLVEDETEGCTALTTVNVTAVIASNEDNNSENKDVSINVDSSESLNNTNLNGENESSSNTIVEMNETPKVTIDVIEPDAAVNESVPLYVKDASGGGSLVPPLYDLVSDDSFCFDSPSSTPVSSQVLSQKTLVNVDDSVIFVSETLKTPKKRFQQPRAEDFIPINNKGLQRMKSRWISPGGKATRRNSPKKLQAANPSQIKETPVTKTVSGIKRMVLIDGNNVAFAHSRNREFSVEGIAICLDYFSQKGYDAKAIIPQMRLKKARSTNQELLEKLESEGKIVFSPCKNLPDGTSVTSYDDRFILDFAADCDAAVISNDNYRDLSKECEKYRHIINTRVIGFTFLNDIIKFPKDPYGKYGPLLDDILNGKEKK